jgi:hypothetical protein
MPRVLFIEDYDYNPAAHGGRWTMFYRKGTEAVVTRECAADAVGKGRAIMAHVRREAINGQDVGRGELQSQAQETSAGSEGGDP